MNRLLHASFDRFPRLVESRYDEAFLYLAARCRKRALVVLVTNVIDEVNSGQVERYLSSLSGRHLPLGVLLRDRASVRRGRHRSAARRQDALSGRRRRRNPDLAAPGSHRPVEKRASCARCLSRGLDRPAGQQLFEHQGAAYAVAPLTQPAGD